MRGERGQIAPALLLFIAALVAGGLILFNPGRATAVQAEAVTAADAGALAGADNLRWQWENIEWLYHINPGAATVVVAARSPPGTLNGNIQDAIRLAQSMGWW